MNTYLAQLKVLTPELALCAGALLLMLLELIIKRKDTIATLTIALVGLVAYLITNTQATEAFNGAFVNDGFSMFFKFLFLFNLILGVLLSPRYLKTVQAEFGEFYTLMVLSTLGMMFMASAGDLIVLYLGLELMAISSYVLAGFVRHDVRSNEAGIKYMLLGAFSSGIILFGITLVYALTGTTEISSVARKLGDTGPSGFVHILMVLFLMAAFGFKIALVPFHVWSPDVYEGAPTPAVAFMSVGPKAAGFAALTRVFYVALSSQSPSWQALAVGLSIATMAIGTVLAIQQTNIKRMLAYSSIAHAGYILMGFAVHTEAGFRAMLVYLLIYMFMNVGAFAVVTMLRSEGVTGEDLDQYKGLAKEHPFVSAVMLLFMFSLTGIPPTAGFIAKFNLFKAVVDAGYTWLAVVAVLFSVVSAFFYLRVVMYMYMYEPEGEVPSLNLSPSLGLALVLLVVGVVVFGVYPSPIVSLAASVFIY